MTDDALGISLAIDRDRIPPDGPSKVHFVAELRGLAQGVDSDRPPLSIVFAVDVSGSMIGPPLEQVAQSIDRLVGLLEPSDRVGVVAFSDNATEVVPLRHVDAETKRLVRTRTHRLQAAGRTHVEAGLRRAAGLMPPRDLHERQIILLLSDGAPNVGLTSAADLGGLARTLRPAISLSTLGYGPRHQEDILSGLATAGGGRYQFIPDPSVCELQLAQAIGAQGDVVAEAIELSLAPSEDVEIGRVLGSAPTRFGSGGLVMSLPDVLEGGRQLVVAELTVHPRRAAGDWVVLRAGLSYRRAGQRAQLSFTHELTVPVGPPRSGPYRDAPSDAPGSLVPQVHAQVLLARGDEVRAEARSLADRGQFDGAATALRRWIAEVEKAPGFTSGDGSPLAEAYELMIDEAVAMERKPSAEDYRTFRKSTISTSLSIDAPPVSTAYASARSRIVMATVAGNFPRAYLEVLAGATAGQRFQLGPRQLIGRTQHAEIQLAHPSISRQHTEIMAQAGVFLIVDLGSTNTTKVNGQRINAPHRLAAGDVIEVGDVKLAYREDVLN
jgi:Ca-activated chloride channel homolog